MSTEIEVNNVLLYDFSTVSKTVLLLLFFVTRFVLLVMFNLERSFSQFFKQLLFFYNLH